MTEQLNRLKLEAEYNLSNFRRNVPYPGMGIVIGLNEEGTHVIMLYFITGRSETIRNLILVAKEDGTLSTDFADPSKATGDPVLLLYDAMLEVEEDDEDLENLWVYAVSSGKQTEDIMDFATGTDLLADWSYEEDPNSTPKINALVILDIENGGFVIDVSIIKKSVLGDFPELQLWGYLAVPTGLAYGITTYRPPQRELVADAYNEDTLNSFYGDLYLFPMIGTPEEIFNSFHQALNTDNFISLAMKTIDLKTGKSTLSVRNKHESVLV